MRRIAIFLVLGSWFCLTAAAAEPAQVDLAAQLRELDATVIPPSGDRGKLLPQMLRLDAKERLVKAAERENEAWHSVQTVADWEKFRDKRVEALRESLGRLPSRDKDPKVRITRTLLTPSYSIANLVIQTRPGLVMTANLYMPAEPPKSMPGILIVPSHHNPKTQGELQDMGMTWASLGCAVLVPDMIGHGERRQHPFRDAKDYPGPFKVGRQDYYFRYNEGVQLQLIGESLMGWMVWDIMCGVDVLLAQPGVDPKRIALLGSVAGGGDPAAVAAALDQRISVVAPFNFGGGQPDFAIPADAERNFYWFGLGSWESTRNLRLGARDGFAHWLIDAAAAPRHLLFCHEFDWQAERDPAWPRLQKVFGLYGVADHLAEAHGKGKLSGKPPESSHCNNIGPIHRRGMYPALKKWLDMPIPQKEITGERRPAQELACLTPEAVKEFQPRLVHELAADQAAGQVWARRKARTDLQLAGLRTELKRKWASLLGDVEPRGDPRIGEPSRSQLGKVSVERLVLEVKQGVTVPVVLLLPPRAGNSAMPVVVGVAQQGKQVFLKKRAEDIAKLLDSGVAVCLPDLRGTGETKPGAGRGHTSAATSISATELILGQTLLGSRLRDLRSVLRYLRTRPELDRRRLALWGDSFAPVNPKERRLDVPLDADPFPDLAEPLGGLMALFGGLYEDQVSAIYARGGLTGYQSVLDSPFFYVPHDALVPGALTAGDLCDVAAVLAPRPLRLVGLVDGLNRSATAEALAKTYAPTRTAYMGAPPEHLSVVADREGGSAARWLLTCLQRRP